MPLHHLMVGTWTPPGAIFTFAFDDEHLTLELVKRTPIPHDEPISWMAFSPDKKTIYGAAMKKWSSFAVDSPSSITHQVSHPLVHDPKAQSPDTNTRAIFLLPHPSGDAVYCNPFYSHAGHGSVFSVEQPSPSSSSSPSPSSSNFGNAGALGKNIQNYPYQPEAGIHGMVFHPDGIHLYSADMGANKLWVHRRRPKPSHDCFSSSSTVATAAETTPELDLVGSVPAPSPNDKPRWVAIHPSGHYLYALMEKGNRICEFLIDPSTRLPVHTHRHWPLIPPGVPDRWTQYRADVCAVSHSGRYLFASSRANSFDLTGYVAAFRLAPEGRIERQICLNPTPTSGGHSNAVSPSDWSDEWLAVTDDQEGWLEIYRWQDEFLARVARVRVPEPGFGMNAIWYD